MSNQNSNRLFYVTRRSEKSFSLYSVKTDHLILSEVSEEVISDFLFFRCNLKEMPGQPKSGSRSRNTAKSFLRNAGLKSGHGACHMSQLYPPHFLRIILLYSQAGATFGPIAGLAGHFFQIVFFKIFVRDFSRI